MPNTVIGRQTTALTKDIIDNVFEGSDVLMAGKTYTTASAEGYLARVQALQEEYINRVINNLKSPQNRKLVGGGRFAGLSESDYVEQLKLLGQQENLDLSLLPLSDQTDILDMYRKNQLKIQEVLKEQGMPRISLPTENEYRSFLRYHVDPAAGLKPGERNTPNDIKYHEN